MIDVEGIKSRADAARAPCAAYWLVVFAYLMIHLFPVTTIINEPGLNAPRSSVASLVGDDWLPSPGVSEIPLVPVTAGVLPAGGYSDFVQVSVPAPARVDRQGFEPRGPPAVVQA